VDIISIDKMSGDVLLTISDHLDWSRSREHQFILQAKLNEYIAFVESGEILERYPKAKGKQVVLKIVFKFKPDLEGREFLSRAKKIVESAGLGFSQELFADSYDN
jgi:hypothetical protein